MSWQQSAIQPHYAVKAEKGSFAAIEGTQLFRIVPEDHMLVLRMKEGV